MTISLKEARNALWILQQFFEQLEKPKDPITEKQKQFIKDLCNQRKKPIPELEGLSKQEASELIEELLKEAKQ
ncbi:MAG: DUF3072 domain-containing protein [Nitrososphaerota archaeon]